jgi:hypothetical protein
MNVPSESIIDPLELGRYCRIQDPDTRVEPEKMRRGRVLSKIQVGSSMKVPGNIKKQQESAVFSKKQAEKKGRGRVKERERSPKEG